MAHISGRDLAALRWQIDPRTIYRCPCGFESTMNVMIGHRHGWKKRPECRGKIVKRWGPSQEVGITPTAEIPQIPPSTAAIPEIPPSPEGTTAEPPPQATTAPVWEYRGADEELPEQKPEDPEAIARRIREELTSKTPTGVGGDGRGELEGDFIVEQTTGPISLQKVRQTVELPPVVLVWYDYFKNQGWFQGDGSISAFVTDFLLDHIRNCFGLRIIIVSETEVQIVEQSRAE